MAADVAGTGEEVMTAYAYRVVIMTKNAGPYMDETREGREAATLEVVQNAMGFVGVLPWVLDVDVEPYEDEIERARGL
jgi:hypothetical protein